MSTPEYEGLFLDITPYTENTLMKAIRVTGYSISILGIVVILGWYLEIDTIKRIAPYYSTMKINVAIALLLLGFVIAIRAEEHINKQKTIMLTLAKILAASVATIGIATILEYIFNLNLGIDQFLILEPYIGKGIISGRMAPSSSICLILLGITFSLNGYKGHQTIAQLLSFVSFLISYGVVVSYIYGVPEFSGLGQLNIMAIHSAIAFVLASLSGLLYFHDHRLIAIALSPSPAGYAVRRVLPIIFIGPVFFGWLRWEFIHFDFLKGPMTTAVLSMLAVGVMSYVANALAWKIHDQYISKVKLEKSSEEQRERQVWRDNLVATLIHDLRSPLTTAGLSAQILGRKKDLTPERVYDLSQKINKEIKRTDRLLRNLLDSAKAQSGIFPTLELKELELKSFLTNNIDDLNQKDRVILECEENIVGMWNEDAIQRIVENLIVNALKYGDPEGIVTLTGKLINPNMVSISVHNWGDPIPEDSQAELFKIFTRNLLIQNKPGWGLGLAAVKTLTNALGGEVEIKSNSEEGTTFFIELPIIQPK